MCLAESKEETVYPDDLLDRFGLACGNLSVASIRLRMASGSSDEEEAANEHRAARREYAEVNKELDDFFSQRT